MTWSLTPTRLVLGAAREMRHCALTDAQTDANETLAALLELIGQRVSVSAAGIDGDPPLALTITGTLAEGTELSPIRSVPVAAMRPSTSPLRKILWGCRRIPNPRDLRGPRPPRPTYQPTIRALSLAYSSSSILPRSWRLMSRSSSSEGLPAAVPTRSCAARSSSGVGGRTRK
jgi:hypothetical protein